MVPSFFVKRHDRDGRRVACQKLTIIIINQCGNYLYNYVMHVCSDITIHIHIMFVGIHMLKLINDLYKIFN